MALFDLNDIHHGWAGRGPVLAGVSLTLAPGEKLAVTGHNGAGKSTLSWALNHAHHRYPE